MSMWACAFCDYGMMIDPVAESEILQRGGYDSLEELWEAGRCQYISEFTGAASCLDDRGECAWTDDWTFDNDQIFYFGLGKQPALCHKAYESVEDIVEELKNDLNDLLPADFDFRSRLCCIVGTYYG